MNVKDLIAQMTLEEKAGMCSGADFWHLKGVERLGIPGVMVSDGPHGLRKQVEGGDHLGINDSIEAVCFPAGCATTSSFDRDLIRKMGEVIGNECQAEKVSVVLGPAANMKRSPLCGRNFEYMSEDPYLAGEMAASYINGVQSKHIGVSMKHFALNNQEHERMSISSEVDERTMREIYLTAFEKAVKQAQPKTIMNSYNRINGVFASENHWLLTEVLRDEWGFQGYVMTDWGAENERVPGLKAGQDLEMPGGNPDNDRLIVEAVRNGELDEAVLDQAVERILNVVFDYAEHIDEKAVFDREADHEKAVAIAQECMVLLKNEEAVLPLKKGEEGILFVGGFAKAPRFQGGGSSHINCHKIDSAFEESRSFADIAYAEGFDTKGDNYDEALQTEAVEKAKKASKIVIFAGLPDVFESEGYDRSHMRMPDCQNQLISKIAEVNPNVIVVLHNGSPVEMPWVSEVKGILEAYIAGEGCGKAVTRILFGEVNPSGHLAETFPVKLEDNPSYLDFPGRDGAVRYGEGIFIGYRYYDQKKMDVLFPFGHGLSYTEFGLSNLKLSSGSIKDTDGLSVTVDVTNTGDVKGKAVVQLYVSDLTGEAIRPQAELKGFSKVELEAGETKVVTMKLDRRSFAYYKTKIHDWYVPSGEYEIRVGFSSRDIALTEKVQVTSTTEIPFRAHPNTMLGELMQYPELMPKLQETMGALMGMLTGESAEEKADGDTAGEEKDRAVSDDMGDAMMRYMPLRALRSFGPVTNENIRQMVDMINESVKS